MRTINTSIYDFPDLITDGYVYVDKTAQLYELAKPNADRIYYLPRPRRFGKSLMISTLKALFQGRRELFQGLAIERTDWDWEKEIKRYFLAFMVFARAEVNSEEQHSLGRPDSVVKTEKAVYIVEFKYGQSAEQALAQCRERRYADAYSSDPRRVVYVGVNYDPAARMIGAVKTERAS